MLDDTNYKESIAPLKTISTLVLGLVLLLLGGCGLILILVLTMWIKSRRKEIAIYLSIGISKAAIFGQILIECFMIAAIAFSLSFFAANALADRMGNALLSSALPQAEQPESVDISAQEMLEAAQNGTSSDLFKLQTNAITPESLDIEISAATFALVILLGGAIILVSVGLSMRFVYKLKPNHLLSQID